MGKVSIRIVILGHLPYAFDKDKITRWKSALFEMEGTVDNFPITSNSDGGDWQFKDSNIEEQLPKRGTENILFAITNVPLEYNFFVRLVSYNRVCLTYYEMAGILKSENVPLENLLLRYLYAVSFFYKYYGGQIPLMNALANIVHDETRGCLFDMNGVKTDVIYSVNDVQLCPSCVQNLTSGYNHRIEQNLVEKVQEELRKIQKK